MSDAKQIGQSIRREVLGAAFVDRNVATASPFYQHFVDFTSTQCWGYVWSREGLNRKTRSMLNLAMLAAMARWNELALHVRGALNNGVTEQEIAEVLLQAGVYAGVPIASEGFKIADRVIAEYIAEQQQP
ncbi:carboxymuconolactone decarboxylase family protein [Herbaspirillum sp. ST 5-3]|uniref:carboxymuconolactone decarboxylase family protein n=1 Tax=Herbaspirillum sp. ST 5-3 TaxID=2567936 RepID=UPI0010A34103|nr:carboxymuconolactone decarboxylase family protein [Herbaspirillum sp. ST 5-3]